MPSATISKIGISAPSRRKLCRMSNSYFDRGFFRVEFALNAKDLAIAQGALCRAAPRGSCGSCCPADRAAHSVRRPNRARAFPRESARGMVRWGRPAAAKVCFGVLPPEMAMRALPRAAAAARDAVDEVLRRAPAHGLRAGIHVIENFYFFSHAVLVPATSGFAQGIRAYARRGHRAPAIHRPIPVPRCRWHSWGSLWAWCWPIARESGSAATRWPPRHRGEQTGWHRPASHPAAAARSRWPTICRMRPHN